MGKQVKIIGSNGQLSLGKEFGNQMVLVDQVEKGVWIIRVGQFVPDSEQFLSRADDSKRLDNALEWASETKPQDNFEKIASEIDQNDNKNRSK